ncbi:hypothetical protein GH714_008254 [Hevea brasiliensis]|uniref:Thioredoxin domain-containing protein n=1 Tax=Hevea brasiliensis TaxID=3981 RepID=A0A6A6KE85_HEVBR|nr:hypothetical protein GH714_008254 [Hevea brasiliensis]
MISTSKLKSVDFYRKIPRDLTEASLSGAGLSIIAALFMELNNYLTVSTSTSVIVDKSSDGDFLRIDFNLSFPSLSCEFASVDVSDVLGTNRLNITKTIRKFSIDHDLRPTGSEFHSGPVLHDINHGDEFDGVVSEGSVSLTGRNFDQYAHQYPILVVNFYAPWCYWSNRLKSSWESAANTMRERYDPELDGRIILGRVDCTEEVDLCRRHHIQGYPSIRIFRKGSDVKEDHGHHDHESYYGDRDTESLLKTMEGLIAPLPIESHKSDNSTQNAKRPAPLTGGCRIEGYVRVKKVPGNLIISARSGSHSFDPSLMNMSHVISHLSFGMNVSPKLMNEAKRLMPYIGRSHDKLNGRSFINHRDVDANVTIEHYLQIVKTEVVARRSSRQNSFVAVIIIIILLRVLITENPKSFSHFITNVCAIIGVFSRLNTKIRDEAKNAPIEPVKLINVEEAAFGVSPAGDGVGLVSTVPVGGDPLRQVQEMGLRPSQLKVEVKR